MFGSNDKSAAAGNCANRSSPSDVAFMKHVSGLIGWTALFARETRETSDIVDRRAGARDRAKRFAKKMSCNSNRLCLRLEQPTAIAIHDRTAVNLAAFSGASGSFVAAVRGMRNLNSLPR
jgi:hypothetical protein